MDQYAATTGRELVEPAHMELAAPSIADAFGRLVERGASRVVVSPLFLFPGRHVQEDIPELVAAAAEAHPDVEVTIADPIGMHPLVAAALDQQLEAALGADAPAGAAPPAAARTS